MNLADTFETDILKGKYNFFRIPNEEEHIKRKLYNLFVTVANHKNEETIKINTDAMLTYKRIVSKYGLKGITFSQKRTDIYTTDPSMEIKPAVLLQQLNMFYEE